MKSKPSPLASMSKHRQRQQLCCDTLRYQQQGGQIKKMANGTAQGLCSFKTDDVILTNGFYCEI